MHDASMLVNSGFLQDLELQAICPMGEHFCVCGDPAYPLRIQL